MPVGPPIGHGDLRIGVPKIEDLLPGEALFNAREEAIVDVLPDSVQALSGVAVVERDKTGGPECFKKPSGNNEREVEEKCPKGTEGSAEPLTFDPPEPATQGGCQPEEEAEMSGPVVERVVEVKEGRWSEFTEGTNLVKSAPRQMVQNPQAEEEIGKVIPKGKLRQVRHEKQGVVRTPEIFASHENGLGEVYQDQFPASVLQEVAPASNAATQITDPCPTQRFQIDQVKVLSEFASVLRKEA